jgi:hypothetical protein
MTKQQAFLLLKGTVVMRDNDSANPGTVALVGYSGFAVNWQNRAIKQPEWIEWNQAQRISMWEPEAKP